MMTKYDIILSHDISEKSHILIIAYLKFTTQIAVKTIVIIGILKWGNVK